MALFDDNSERREHFRINDTIFLEYQVLDNETAEKLGENIADLLFSSNQQQAQMRKIQAAFTVLTDQINHQDRDVARALRLLNEKIDLLNLSLLQQQREETETEATDVNLSGGGMAFLSNEPLPVKTPFSIQMNLPSTNITIEAIAHLVSCTTAQSTENLSSYHYRLVFTYMSEPDRNLLIKHVLSRQAEVIRSNRSDGLQ